MFRLVCLSNTLTEPCCLFRENALLNSETFSEKTNFKRGREADIAVRGPGRVGQSGTRTDQEELMKVHSLVSV